jgi:hypothetical protein
MNRKHNRVFYGWWVVAAVGLFWGVPLTVYSFSVFLRPLMQDFHAGRAAVPLAVTLQLVVGALTTPLAGWLIGRQEGKANWKINRTTIILMTEAEFNKHLETAEKSPKEIAATVSGLSEKMLRNKPPADKWCVPEVLGHLADVEIRYRHRLWQMLYDEKPTIASMDQNAWAKNLGYTETPVPKLVAFYGFAVTPI